MTDHDTIVLSLTVLYAITMLVALVGNTLLIYIVWKKPRTRNLTSFMFVNMAVADLMVVVFQMPVSITHFYVSGSSEFLQVFSCRFLYYAVYVSTIASIFCLTVIAFDRYFAVVHPFRRSIWFRKPKIITPVVWISSIALMSVVPVAFKSVNGVCFFDDTVISPLVFWSCILALTYLLPLAIISILYIIVAGKLWLHEMPADHEVREHQRQQEIPKKKVIRMLTIVVVVFAVCWLPVHVYQMDNSVKMGALWPPSLIYFCYWLSQANSAINPWLYIGLNKKMKAAFTKMIRCCRTGNLRQETSSVGTNTRSETAFTTRSLLDTKL